MCAERSSPAAPKRRGSGSSCEMRRASSKSGGSEKTRRTGARRVDEKAEAAPLPAASGRVSIYPPGPAAGGETHAAFDARWTPAGPHREDWPLAFGSLIVALRSKYTWYPSLVRRPHRENRVSEAHRAQFSRWGLGAHASSTTGCQHRSRRKPGFRRPWRRLFAGTLITGTGSRGGNHLRPRGVRAAERPLPRGLEDGLR